MKSMMQTMHDPTYRSQLDAKMGALKDDPELAGIFEEMEKGGPAAMMKRVSSSSMLSELLLQSLGLIHIGFHVPLSYSFVSATRRLTAKGGQMATAILTGVGWRVRYWDNPDVLSKLSTVMGEAFNPQADDDAEGAAAQGEEGEEEEEEGSEELATVATAASSGEILHLHTGQIILCHCNTFLNVHRYCTGAGLLLFVASPSMLGCFCGIGSPTYVPSKRGQMLLIQSSSLPIFAPIFCLSVDYHTLLLALRDKPILAHKKPD